MLENFFLTTRIFFFFFFLRSINWLRDHAPGAQQVSESAIQPANQIHQPGIGPLSPIDVKELQRRREIEKTKRKLDLLNAQASPLDGAGEETQAHLFGSNTSSSSSTQYAAVVTSAVASAAIMGPPSNKKANVQSSSDMQS